MRWVGGDAGEHGVVGQAFVVVARWPLTGPSAAQASSLIVYPPVWSPGGLAVPQGAPLNESDHCGDPPLLLAAGNGAAAWGGRGPLCSTWWLSAMACHDWHNLS